VKRPAPQANADADADFASRSWVTVSMLKPISPAGLEGLDRWTYKGGEYTPVDNMLNPFWFACAEMLPTTMAPNLVTLMGFICTVGAYVLMATYSPSLDAVDVPAWANVTIAVLTFAYQTLDAMDGKQARRTGTSSPLGQLFDHGCDTISAMLLALTVAATAQLGPTVWTLAFLCAVQVPFFCAQWSEYHTHTMAHSVGNIGVTEAQLFNMGIHLLSAALAGTNFWVQRFSALVPASTPALAAAGLLDLQVNHVTCVLFCLPPLILASTFVARVLTSDATESKASAALQLLPIVILAGLASAWTRLKIFELDPRLVLVMIGLLFSYLTLQIIVCGMCRVPYPTMQPLVAGVPLVFFAARSGILEAFGIQERGLLVGYLGVIVLSLGGYIVGVISQICKHLDIYCLTIKHLQKSG